MEEGEKAAVLALSGDLGAGKTAFSQALARELGVEENVVSPTFVIMKMYETKSQYFTRMVHIDAYRLNSHEELLKLGWTDILADPKTVVLIEWPEQVPEAIPEDARLIALEHVSETERLIRF